jgi:uncharacterized alkaline shock family protein YloU
MSSKIINKYGTIGIDNEVILKIAGLAAMECFGVVGMAAKNVKDGLFQLLKKESLTKGIKMELIEDCVTIDLHIIVEYGTNISAIADTLVSAVKYKIEQYVGLKVEHINIHVEGLRIDS